MHVMSKKNNEFFNARKKKKKKFPRSHPSRLIIESIIGENLCFLCYSMTSRFFFVLVIQKVRNGFHLRFEKQKNHLYN